MTFELTPIQENGLYVLQDYENIVKELDEYLKTCHLDLQVTNASDLELVNKTRTELRKKLDKVTNVRKQINEILLGKFNEQLFELEHKMKKADDTLKAKKDAFNAKPKPKTISVKSYNVEIIEKVKEYAKELGCVVEEK